MRISEDKEKYLKYYVDNICFKGELDVSCIKMMAELKGQGAEYV